MTLDQHTAHMLRQERGVELTQAEVRQIRKEALEEIRIALRVNGLRAPETDDGLLMLVGPVLRRMREETRR